MLVVVRTSIFFGVVSSIRHTIHQVSNQQTESSHQNNLHGYENIIHIKLKNLSFQKKNYVWFDNKSSIAIAAAYIDASFN